MGKGYQKLIAWQKTDRFAFELYVATTAFPSEEVFGITSQMRRAALSIPTNIAEGAGRQGRKELRQFLNIALGSLAEVDYLLDFSRGLGYLSVKQYESLEKMRVEAGALLWRFYHSIV